MNAFDPTRYTRSKWLKGSDLPKGRPIVVTIAEAYEHEFEQSGEVKPVLTFSDHDQALTLNKTKITTLIDLFGTDVLAWVGQRINLQAVPSQFAGKPTIMITLADQPLPTAQRQAPAMHRQPTAQRQPAVGGVPPTWASEPPSDDDLPA